ncbi:MAG: Npt1/Npt2 family nucleotide transporter [Myxococcota bacterium]|nr:Npt1/Npt2 family nucleotide transporter [Myxococcota bacterium]
MSQSLFQNRTEFFRLAGLCAIAFFCMLGYAWARSPIESVFLEDWGKDRLPLAWIGVALGALATVSMWDRLASRLSLPRLIFALSAGSCVGLAILLGAREAGVRQASFLAYIFKDLYIVLLVESFYAFANATYPLKTARWAYGLFGVMASLGGRVGNKSLEELASSMGSGRVPWLVLPTFLVVCFFVGWISRGASESLRLKKDRPPGLIDAVRTVRSSRYLVWMVVLIASIQLATNLIDYVYQGALQEVFVLKDERTGISGDVYASIDDFTLALNLSAGVILSRMGVSLTLLAIPFLVGLSAGLSLLIPGFFVLAICKVANKAFDYSIFRVAKEALYLPLGIEQKTKGKAVVDVLTYRLAKGGASLLSFVLIVLGLQHGAMALALLLMGIWLYATVRVLRKYQQLLDEQAKA